MGLYIPRALCVGIATYDVPCETEKARIPNLKSYNENQR